MPRIEAFHGVEQQLDDGPHLGAALVAPLFALLAFLESILDPAETLLELFASRKAACWRSMRQASYLFQANLRPTPSVAISVTIAEIRAGACTIVSPIA